MLILNAPNDLWKIAHLPAYVQDSAASDLKYNHCVILLESREETKCLINKELRASCCLPPKGQIIFPVPLKVLCNVPLEALFSIFPLHSPISSTAPERLKCIISAVLLLLKRER